MVNQRLLIRILFLTFICLDLTMVRAESIETQAQSLLQKGRTLFKDGKYVEAIKALKASLDLKEHANTYYYLGASYRRLGRFRIAYQHYLDFANEQPKAKRSKLLKRYMRLLRWDPPVAFRVESNLDVDLWIDKRFVEKLKADHSFSTKLIGGTHRVELKKGKRLLLQWIVVAEYGEPLMRKATFAETAPQAIQKPEKEPSLFKAEHKDKEKARNENDRILLRTGLGFATQFIRGDKDNWIHFSPYLHLDFLYSLVKGAAGRLSLYSLVDYQFTSSEDSSFGTGFFSLRAGLNWELFNVDSVSMDWGIDGGIIALMVDDINHPMVASPQAYGFESGIFWLPTVSTQFNIAYQMSDHMIISLPIAVLFAPATGLSPQINALFSFRIGLSLGFVWR